MAQNPPEADQQSLRASDELRDRLRRFLSRSTEVLGHPLAGTISEVSFTIKVNNTTGQIVGADFDPKLQDQTSWGYLATLLRPLIFLTNDAGSVGQLMNLIKRDFPALRDSGISAIQQGLNQWRTTPLVGIADLGPVDQFEVPGDGTVSRIWTGQVGSVPADVDLSAMAPDYEFADVYFNGRLWHADAEKVDQFDSATALQKTLMAKCAEVRTLSAVQWIRYLHDWIIDARTAGWPL